MDMILHHYPPSPVAEKIRKAFGIKGAAWASVEQNRLPDRPELFAMAGGYRRIPVLQVGADLYCDSQLILKVVEGLAPEPTLFPGGGYGMPFALSRWTDGEMFDLAFRIAVAPALEKMPADVLADRIRLYLGPEGDIERELADLPHTIAQFAGELGWVEERLSSGRSFLLGDAPGMPDVLIWYLHWFLSARWDGAGAFFARFPAVTAWAALMEGLGHGSPTDMTPDEALAIARDSAPRDLGDVDPEDPQGLPEGAEVAITPLTDSGETPVTGALCRLERDRLAIRRTHPDCGDTVVHFPRVGYRVSLR